MANHERQHFADLEQVLIALEDVWARERNPHAVEEFAREYPEFADDLYDYFESLLNSEIRPFDETSAGDGLKEALRTWFESEGRELARSLAADERRVLAQAGETSTPTSTGAPRSDSVRPNEVTPQERVEPGPTVESVIGYLKRFTGRSVVEVAVELTATPAFLRLINADPSSVPEEVKRTLARLALERLGVPEEAVTERLAQTGSFPMAASRDGPYSGGTMTFSQMLDASGLTDDQRRFWTEVARGDREG